MHCKICKGSGEGVVNFDKCACPYGANYHVSCLVNFRLVKKEKPGVAIVECPYCCDIQWKVEYDESEIHNPWQDFFDGLLKKSEFQYNLASFAIIWKIGLLGVPHEGSTFIFAMNLLSLIIYYTIGFARISENKRTLFFCLPFVACFYFYGFKGIVNTTSILWYFVP